MIFLGSRIFHGVYVAPDPYWDDVVLYLPFDGANNSTTLTDVSPTPKTVTCGTSGKIVTSTSRFGGASFDPGATTSGTVTSVDDASLAFGADDFTIECFINPKLIYTGEWGIVQNTEFGLYFRTDTVQLYTASTWRQAIGALSAGTWYHVALTRESGTARVFVNGTKAATDYTWSTSLADTELVIGYNDRHYIDCLRITSGVARYTADFTPPVIAFPTTGP